jgi:hypothetical protein
MATPSLLLIPDRYKSGVLYSQLPESGAGDIDFTRASAATLGNASGLIESVASGVPRLDYTGGGCPSLLLEPQRTNLFLNSASGATQSITVTAEAHTLSFYGTGSVTLSDVASGTLEGTGTGVANRVSLTFTPTAGTLTLTVSGTITDVQLEEGSYPTSYIPTTSAAVTRAADAASKGSISSLVNNSAGTLYFEVLFDKLYDGGGSGPSGLEIGDGGNFANIISIGVVRGATNQISVFNRNASTNVIVNSINIISVGVYKCAFSYDATGNSFYVNGSLVSNYTAGSSSTAGVINSFSRLTLGGFWIGSTAISQNNDGILAAAIYPTRLSNSELASLTSL